MTKLTDMLTAYGISSQGGEIDCIVSHDGGMVTGIISALEAAGIQPGEVALVACGSNQVLYDAMSDGWLPPAPRRIQWPRPSWPWKPSTA